MNEFDFYKGLFERELTRRKDLDASISQTVTILSIVGGLLYFLYTKSSVHDCSLVSNLMLLSTLLAFLCIIIGLICLIISFNNWFKGNTYKDFPKTKELYDYHKELEDYNSKVDKNIQKQFDEYLIKKFVSYTDDHIMVNDKRSLYLHKTRICIILTLLIEVVGFIFYVLKT